MIAAREKAAAEDAAKPAEVQADIKEATEGNRKSRRSQGKSGDRGADIGLGRQTTALMLCRALNGGRCSAPKGDQRRCRRITDLDEFFKRRPEPLDDECPVFARYGRCPAGLNCRFRGCIDLELRKTIVKPGAEGSHIVAAENRLHPRVMQMLRKRKYRFQSVRRTPRDDDGAAEGGRGPKRGRDGAASEADGAAKRAKSAPPSTADATTAAHADSAAAATVDAAPAVEVTAAATVDAAPAVEATAAAADAGPRSSSSSAAAAAPAGTAGAASSSAAAATPTDAVASGTQAGADVQAADPVPASSSAPAADEVPAPAVEGSSSSSAAVPPGSSEPAATPVPAPEEATASSSSSSSSSSSEPTAAAPVAAAPAAAAPAATPVSAQPPAAAAPAAAATVAPATTAASSSSAAATAAPKAPRAYMPRRHIGDDPPMSELRGSEGRDLYNASRPTHRERWAGVERFRAVLPRAAIIAPLTTVGNLPFRRLCTGLGADVTVGEMAVAGELLKGMGKETALLGKHPSERTFGMQITGGNRGVLGRVCELLERECTSFDFVDLNMGCPLDMVCKKNMGAQLMYAGSRFEGLAQGMAEATSRPITLKMRTGSSDRTRVADELVTRARRTRNVAAVTVHGRTRQARYTKTADWGYIKHVVDEASLPLVGAPTGGAAAPQFGGAVGSALAAAADAASATGRPTLGTASSLAEAATESLTAASDDFPDDIPALPIIGNGDVLDPSDFFENIATTGVTTCMLGRGILYKPWLCEEIKAGVAIDKTARERLEMYRTFCRHGLEYWGTDQMGVDHTRRFLLELLSFAHRYVPHGLLAQPPQRMNLRPEAFRGRDDLETVLASSDVADWVRISEMFLGKVRDDFRFVPKHRARTFGLGSTAVAAEAGLSVRADDSLTGLHGGTAASVVKTWG